MSVTCPQGHPSSATDYCDVCGEPIASTPAPAPTTPVASAPARTCPHCGSPGLPDALFCEICGYDFTTGQLPDPAPAPLSPPGLPGQGVSAGPGAASGSGPSGAGTGGPAPDPLALPGIDPEGGLAAPPVPGPDEWLAELWIDPDWYAAQAPEDPLPSVGAPLVVPLRQRSVLVGRPSVSRNIRPQVDCGADSGVSRRHCQLTSDGRRWWVEDLQSANGTYVAGPGEPLPSTPLIAGQRRELQDGDRLFVGGWTRLVVRRALPGEVA